MDLFCFTKILNLAFYMTHTFDSEVSLHYWMLCPRVCHLCFISPKIKVGLRSCWSYLRWHPWCRVQTSCLKSPLIPAIMPNRPQHWYYCVHLSSLCLPLTILQFLSSTFQTNFPISSNIMEQGTM
jgi:hypothetical protein